MYCRMCVDVHGLTPTKLNQPSEAEFLVSHCYEGDLRHKHDENQGFYTANVRFMRRKNKEKY